MALSAMSGIPFGMTMRSDKQTHASVKVIESDGRVDDAFVQSDASFIGDIEDPRVKAFAATGQTPGEGWKAHDLGGFDSSHQSLFIEDGSVVLRTTIEEDGDKVSHRITAPFDAATGDIRREDSSEGFNIAHPNAGGGTATFKIPL